MPDHIFLSPPSNQLRRGRVEKEIYARSYISFSTLPLTIRQVEKAARSAHGQHHACMHRSFAFALHERHVETQNRKRPPTKSLRAVQCADSVSTRKCLCRTPNAQTKSTESGALCSACWLDNCKTSFALHYGVYSKPTKRCDTAKFAIFPSRKCGAAGHDAMQRRVRTGVASRHAEFPTFAQYKLKHTRKALTTSDLRFCALGKRGACGTTKLVERLHLGRALSSTEYNNKIARKCAERRNAILEILISARFL